MNRFAFLIALFSTLVFGQETTDHVRPGIQISSVFSSSEAHGISPALTLNFRRLMFSVGPRFSYNRMFREKSTFYVRNKKLIIDASFRYYFMSEAKRTRLFAQAGAEYKYSHIAYDYDYITGEMLTYGPQIDYSFRGEWDRKTHYLGVYGGFGVDVRIWKQLTAFVSCGAGTSFSHNESVLYNIDSEQVEYTSKHRSNAKFSWIASTGFGYRF
jgi:hypothetical protein